METIVEKKIIKSLKEFFEKQEEVEELTSAPFLESYTHVELHTLDYIGKNKDTNVTSISQNLNITRGAASKITKRLLNKSNVEKYQSQKNKKEIYFRLTKQGKTVFDAHAKRHAIWVNNDLDFLKKIQPETKEIILEFIEEFNTHLDGLIKKEK